MEPAICFEMLFPGLAPEEKVDRVAAAGFEAVEFWGWRDKNLPALREACARSGVRVLNFSGHRRGSLIASATHQLLLADLAEAAAAAGALGCSYLMLLSNELGEGGRVMNSHPEIPAEEKRRNLRSGLERALEAAPAKVTLLLEPLNTRIDHEGNYLSDTAMAASLVREIGHPRLKVLCDLYHMGVMGEDLAATIERHMDAIGYFHVADFPGRHEPGTGSGGWAKLLRRIAAAGYQGVVGFEYAPAADSAESLRRIRRLWEEAVG